MSSNFWVELNNLKLEAAKQAYLNGVKAKLAGTFEYLNPHDPSSSYVLWVAWRRGWNESSLAERANINLETKESKEEILLEIKLFGDICGICCFKTFFGDLPVCLLHCSLPVNNQQMKPGVDCPGEGTFRLEKIDYTPERTCFYKVPKKTPETPVDPVDPKKFGYHEYIHEITNASNLFHCKFGCGCWEEFSARGGPVNPWGPCPNNPKGKESESPGAEFP